MTPSNAPPLWTAIDAAAAVNGRLQGKTDWMAQGVSIDSRSLMPGDLFIALQGPHFDGTAFVADALRRGAAAAIVGTVPPGLDPGAPLLMVEKPGVALDDLGRMGRIRARAKVICVTGSVGKTGVKEALRAMLGASRPTFATAGNLNNHWGTPLSLARLPQDAFYGVFELGMNHAGEIANLSRMARPDIAVITTVDAVHLEFFPSIEAIADAKAEIFQAMDPAGTAIINRDNPHYARLLAHARTQGLARILSFGADAGADARLLDIDAGPDGSTVRANLMGRALRYRVSVPGHHHALNSLAALLAVQAAGADLDKAVEALAVLTPVKGRGGRSTVALPRGAFQLIDESYNASPVSVTAALTLLGQTPVASGGRRIAALGDMLELGASGPALHAGLAASAAHAGIDRVFACGPLMAHLIDALPEAMRGGHCPDSATLAALLTESLRPGDAVMVKGSAGSRMNLIVEALKALDTRKGTNDAL
jgi:UDP-N-acetylmuramoyl-tripeptide--D-alanyl-D-alanine ligase